MDGVEEGLRPFFVDEMFLDKEFCELHCRSKPPRIMWVFDMSQRISRSPGLTLVKYTAAPFDSAAVKRDIVRLVNFAGQCG